MLRSVAVILVLSLLPTLSEAARREPELLLQSTTSEEGWILSIDGRRGQVRASDGGRQRFTVRRSERWLGFSEFSEGWIALGIRSRKDSLDLSLVANLGRGPRRLTAPGDRTGTLRTAPRAIGGNTGLAGLAWLEGDALRGLSVRAAALEGSTFGTPHTVSAPGAGSQTGLTSVMLDDGSWILAWSRFDGEDDEIYWARREPDGSWSAARRVAGNNHTPDVTPQLLARNGTAMLAWSRLDDEYEVVTSVLTSSGWSTPRSLGINGSITPAFRRLPEADYLLVRNAWPAGWTAVRLDTGGQPADFAAVAESSQQAPILRANGGQQLTFEWAHKATHEPLHWEPMP